MRFKTHNDTFIKISGTSLVSELRASYSQLIEAFGEPKDGDGYKVDVEWQLQFQDGTVATIYNWKNGPAYGECDSVESITEWNIGGFSSKAGELVEQVLWAGK